MINRVELLGHLGRDPEIRTTQSGTSVGTLNVATFRKWTNQTGERQEETTWHRVVVWGRMAENAGQYLAKGLRVYVQGRIQVRPWTDNEGRERRSYEIVAEDVKFLDFRDREGGDQRGGNRRQDDGGGYSAGRASGGSHDPPPEDDDIPF